MRGFAASVRPDISLDSLRMLETDSVPRQNLRALTSIPYLSDILDTLHAGNAVGAEHPQSDLRVNTDEFRYSPDFRTIIFRRKRISLTQRQALVVGILYDAYEHGTPELSQSYVLEQIGTQSSELRDTFRKAGLWGKLVILGTRKGTVRLNLPEPPTSSKYIK